MRNLCFVLFGLLVPGAAMSQAVTPQIVEISSGELHLRAFLWKPPGEGPLPAVLFNHGRSDTPHQHGRNLTLTEAAQILGPIFVKHGYVFLFPCRRGEGLSADRGPFIGDLLQREQAAKGEEARQHLQLLLMTADHLADATAGLSFLKSLRCVDDHRITIAGHSFGGQLTLLLAERESWIRAAIAFAPAAGSWDGSPEHRERLLAAVRRLTVPVMFLQAKNDYSLAPTQAMSDEMSRLSKRCVRKIYPPVGETANDGHNFLYTDTSRWEPDVFAFLDENVTRRSPALK